MIFFNEIINSVFFVQHLPLNIISPHKTPTRCVPGLMPGLSFSFHVNIRQELMLYFFVANIKNIIHSMQVLNVFNSSTDTMGPLIISFITCSYKIVKALIGSRIFTQGSVHAHLCRQRFCLKCHEPNNWNKCQKELSDNCQSDVSCNWNISFSLSFINFSLSWL